MDWSSRFVAALAALGAESESTAKAVAKLGTAMEGLSTLDTYVALHTAQPGLDQSVNEISYGGYARQPISEQVVFPVCVSGYGVITHASLGSALSGPSPVVAMMPLHHKRAVAPGDQPVLTIEHWLESMPMKKPKLQSTATTWVAMNRYGQYEAVLVSAMSDAHLFRWIRYFRKKFRKEGCIGSDAVVDAVIRSSIITAPAIFAEAAKRGVYTPPQAAATSPSQRPAVQKAERSAVPGERRIELDED